MSKLRDDARTEAARRGEDVRAATLGIAVGEGECGDCGVYPRIDLPTRTWPDSWPCTKSAHSLHITYETYQHGPG